VPPSLKRRRERPKAGSIASSGAVPVSLDKAAGGFCFHSVPPFHKTKGFVQFLNKTSASTRVLSSQADGERLVLLDKLDNLVVLDFDLGVPQVVAVRSLDYSSSVSNVRSKWSGLEDRC